MPPLVSLLRTGDFLTCGRARLWAGAMVAALALAVMFLALSAHGVNDYDGRPLGTDFSNVYAAGRAALAGDAAAPFDIVRQGAMERVIFGAKTQLYGWHYPPVFLLAATPLAALPYVPALLLWLGVTLLLYLLSTRLLLAGSAAPQLAQGSTWLILALGFPAVFINFIHGQNGFLTAALFGFGLALRDRRPALSGIAFGLLCYKPQYLALIPLVLVASARWRVLAFTAGTALAACLAATLLFGAGIWPAFLASTHFTRTVVLEQGNTGFAKLQSVFAAVRLLGGGIAQAYAAQAASAALAMFGVWRLWRQRAGYEIEGAALCLAALLVTPYCLDYDLVALAPVIALLSARGRARGFADWEILMLTALWALPGLARPIGQHLDIPVMVPAMLLTFGCVWLRAENSRLVSSKSAAW